MRAILLFCCLAAAVLAQESTTPAVNRFDPVELVKGTEVPGKTEFNVVRGRFHYFFANAENLKAFEDDPARFEVQLEGACARMGPGSGAGKPDLFAVHDGRIYVFASEGCRATFRKRPADFLDPDEAAPTGDAKALKAGAELIKKAVAAMGGAAAVDGPCDVVETRTWTEKSGEKVYDRKSIFVFSAPRGFRTEEHWSEWNSVRVETPESAAKIWTGKSEPVAEGPLARREFQRQTMRRPLFLLRARKAPDYKAVYLGAEKVGDATIEKVAVGFSGMTTTISIDGANGRIVRATFRGRADDGFARTAKTYGDFRAVGALVLPFAVSTVLDDKASEVPGDLKVEIAVRPQLADDLFRLAAK